MGGVWEARKAQGKDQDLATEKTHRKEFVWGKYDLTFLCNLNPCQKVANNPLVCVFLAPGKVAKKTIKTHTIRFFCDFSPCKKVAKTMPVFCFSTFVFAI